MRLGIKSKIYSCIDYIIKYRLPHFRFWLHRDTTQYGEFSCLRSILGKRSGIVVDVGANDGMTCSNSYPFIKRGWKGILIEPHPHVFARLSSLYQGNQDVQLINLACGVESGQLPLFEGSGKQTVYATLSTENSEWYDATRSNQQFLVDVRRLEDILQTISLPEQFDLLSIDTEGYDYFVLLGLNLARYKPHVIITEDEKPPFTHSVDKENLLRKYGYRFLRRFHNNALWINEKTGRRVCYA